MSKPISLSQTQWNRLYDSLKKEVPISTLMIRSRMREQLGFTKRDHAKWNQSYTAKTYSIELDFYDESKRLMFLLKYSDIVSKTKDSVL